MIALATVYGAYGESTGKSGQAQTAYAGEAREADTGWYMLGARPYNPTLRRFIGPDRASPFDRGDVNRYAYCGGDPVNRIDPSGHSWLGWLGASQGLNGSGGAALSVSATSRGMDTASTTPGVMASSAAAVTDALSVTSAMDSVALMSARRSRSGGLFGWTAMGATVTSGGSALPAARRGSRAERFLGRRHAGQRSGRGEGERKHTVQLVMDGDVPANRLVAGSSANPYLLRRWKRGYHFENPRSHIWAADTSIGSSNVTNLLTNLSKKKRVTQANLYTGGHGNPDGMNWDPQTGKRLDPHRAFFDQDRDGVEKDALEMGITINLIDLGSETKQSIARRLRVDGVHIMSTCFGLSDEVVMESLNLSHVTVYDLTP
jgi:RHS repeat-associated protein